MLNLPTRLVAFVDPYWLGPDSSSLTSSLIQALHSVLPPECTVDRLYFYSEADISTGGNGVVNSCTIRVCARDSIDDGYELIRAMDSDLQQLAESRVFSTFLVVSMDDRLALSIERIKATGTKIWGLRSKVADENDESFRRMSRIFDQMLGPVKPLIGQPNSASKLTLETTDAVDQAIEQWFSESDEIARDGALEFMNSRRGLPRMVDSRLLFLASQLLDRDLFEPEKFELRRRFRQAAYDRGNS